MAMAIIDFARVNAYQTQLVWRKQNQNTIVERDPHRVFVSSLCVSLIQGSWQNDTVVMQSNVPMVFHSFNPDPDSHIAVEREPVCPSSTTSSRYLFSPPNPKIVSCNPSTPPAPNPGKRTRLANCVVCHFERDARVSKHSRYCKLHKVSCCIKSHAILPNTADWACSENISCWDKYHSFYLKNQIFSYRGKMKPSSNACKARKMFFENPIRFI